MTCLDNSLLQWLSKCDVWINSTSIICELVRNANFRSHPRPTELQKKKSREAVVGAEEEGGSFYA